MKSRATVRAGTDPSRVGDTGISELGMAAIIGRDKTHRVRGGAYGVYDPGDLIRIGWVGVTFSTKFS
jgi:hypothetical protein